MGIRAEAAAQDQQSFRVDRFAPAVSPEDSLALPHPETVGHLRPFVGLIFDYGYAPLRARRGDGETIPLVEHRLLAHLNGGLGITDRVELHLRVPMAITMAGGELTGVPRAESFSMGDGAIGGSVRILGEGDRQGLWMGATAELLVPMGVENGFASDLEVGARALLSLAYGIPAMTTLVVLGASYRPERGFENARSASELEFAIAFSFVMTTWMELWVELLGSSIFRLADDEPYFFSPRGTPLELLAGARATTDLGIAIELGIGFGLTSAPGVPTVRTLLGVRWAMAPSAPVDADGDGAADAGDQCPGEEEDVDGWQDDDGCRDPDNDGDGTIDEDDACPREDEDRDGIRDHDGCADPDDDEDGMDDRRDACPREPGPDWTRGCPQTVRISDDGTAIEILRPLAFEGDTATLAEAAAVPLDELRAILAVDGRMRIRIEVRAAGAPTGRGRRATRADLGNPRAQAIAAWLIAHAIDAGRIEAAGLPLEGGEPTITITVLDRTPMPEEAR